MISAPCGTVCDECPMFGRPCEGCHKEMSYSFAYHCREYNRQGSEKARKCTGLPCKVADGKYCLCPLILQKSLRPAINFSPGPETPVN